MKDAKLSSAPISMKVFITILLCTVGLMYIALLFQIYQDSEMKPSLIIEGYGEMEEMELTHHTMVALPYYALFLFAIPTLLLMFSSYSEKLKTLTSIWVYLVIIIDIASMWLIPYLAHGFCYVLWVAGTLLATTFLVLFLLLLYDIWLRGRKRAVALGDAGGQ